MNTGNKQYYTIGEISEITGIKQSVLRFWEDQFPELSPVKNKFGHRVYTHNDIQIITTIKKSLYDDGMTIKGAIKQLHRHNDKPDSIKNELTEILKLLRSLKQ